MPPPFSSASPRQTAICDPVAPKPTSLSSRETTSKLLCRLSETETFVRRLQQHLRFLDRGEQLLVSSASFRIQIKTISEASNFHYVRSAVFGTVKCPAQVAPDRGRIGPLLRLAISKRPLAPFRPDNRSSMNAATARHLTPQSFARLTSLRHATQITRAPLGKPGIDKDQRQFRSRAS